MASPQGLFIGLSLSALQAELTLAQDRIRYGDRVALSGAGKSSARSFSLSASDHVREAQYALGKLTGTLPPSRTHFNANDTLR